MPPLSFKSTRAAESASTTNTLLQLLDFLDLGSDDALQHQLGNPVPLLHFVVCIGMVEEQDLDLAAVISVDDSRPGVDKVFGREARPGSNSAIYGQREVLARNSTPWASGIWNRPYTFPGGQPC